jgi:hypothetical protein
MCKIAGHLSWVSSEVTCRNKEEHENVEIGLLVVLQVVIPFISVKTKMYAGKEYNSRCVLLV